MNTITAQQLEEAKEQLPKEFIPIDDSFKEKYEAPLSVIREFLADKGKLQLLEVEDRQVLIRIPNQQMLTDVRKRSEKLSAYESDMLLVGRCIYYPKIEVVDSWASQGQPGLMTAFAARLMELGLVNIKATSKEF